LDLLQLHIDLNGDSIALVDKLKLYDRILELTESRQARFQYAAAKGVELTLAGDKAGAVATTEAAIRIGRESEKERSFGPNAELWFCKLLEVAGIALSDRECFVESARRLKTLLTLTDHFTPAGRGHLYRCLGDVL